MRQGEMGGMLTSQSQRGGRSRRGQHLVNRSVDVDKREWNGKGGERGSGEVFERAVGSSKMSALL